MFWCLKESNKLRFGRVTITKHSQFDWTYASVSNLVMLITLPNSIGLLITMFTHKIVCWTLQLAWGEQTLGSYPRNEHIEWATNFVSPQQIFTLLLRSCTFMTNNIICFCFNLTKTFGGQWLWRIVPSIIRPGYKPSRDVSFHHWEQATQ